MRNKLPLLAAGSAILSIMIATGIVERSEQRRFDQQQRINTLNQLSTVRASLESSLNSRLFLTQSLVAYVSNHPTIKAEDFANFANYLLEQKSGIKIIKLAKNSLVSHIYPKPDQYHKIGENIWKNNELSIKAIEQSLSTQKSVVAGPLSWAENDLAEKTQVIINYQPIFLPRKNNQPALYWGMATVIIDRNILLTEAGIDSLSSTAKSPDFPDKNRIKIALRGRNGLGNQGEIFFGKAEIFQKQPIVLDIYFPNGKWQLAAIPENGWETNPPIVWWLRLAGVLFASLVGILIYIIVQEPEKLRQAIDRATNALKESEERFKILAEASFEGIIIHRKGKILDTNQLATLMVGYPMSELIGKKLLKFLAKEDRKLGLQYYLNNADRLYTAKGAKKDGTTFPVEIYSKLISYQGELAQVVAIRDISLTKKTEADLLKAKEQIQAVLEAVPGFVCWISEDLHYLGVNQYWAEICQLSADYLMGKPLNLTADNTNKLSEFMKNFFAKEEQMTCEEIKIKIEQENKFFLVAAQKYDRGQAAVVVGIEITERYQAQDKLRDQAFHDALTNLPNRALFLLRLQLAVKRSEWDPNYLFAILFLDLDRFKVINDSLGHSMGDLVLITTGKILQSQLANYNPTESPLRAKDVVARFGGDEFTIFLDDIEDSREAIDLVENLQNTLKKPINLNGHELFLTASVGIVFSKEPTENDSLNSEENESIPMPDQVPENPQLFAENMMRDVDIALYWAKSMGKGRYAVFYPAMHDRTLKLMQLERDLRQAIENQELQLYYQPIVCLKTNWIYGFEALVRWCHPSRGMISPLEFISVAEETGLILPLGSWVMQEACQQMSLWQNWFPGAEKMTISVNLSGHQFSQANLVEEITEILQSANLAEGSLKLEITETSIAEGVESAIITLRKLKKLGIKLSIDDFGTGYSSLSRLNELPIDTLKIDRAFIARLGENGENSELVKIILNLAQSFKMDTVAEGIETLSQVNQLRSYECQYGQGYFFSKPVDSKLATALIEGQLRNIHSF